MLTVKTEMGMNLRRSLQWAFAICLIASLTTSVSSAKPSDQMSRSKTKLSTSRSENSRKLPVLDTSQMEIYEHPKSIQSRSKRQAYPPLYHGDINLTPFEGHPRESGPWGPYSVVQVCSRTCGGGVQIETRDCPPTSHCTGPKKRYVSCNIEECPEPQTDFRAEQCAAYDDKPFEGKFYSWAPNTRAPIRCELSCIPQGENFFYRFKATVVDGTKCDALTNDVCVEGVCMPVGCDKKLGSMAKEDKCRVCSGDGSSCKTIEGLFDETDLEIGYNDILTIPAGATSIVIQERRPTNNYLAIRNESDYYYLNGGWKIDFPQELSIAGTIFEYDRTKQGNLNYDKLTALGPTTEELKIVLLYQAKNVGVQYEYSLPLDETAKYEYRPGPWSECSVTCGQGVHTRELQCYDRKREQLVENELCSNSSEPETNKTCNTVNCAAEWFLGEWEECSASCGTAGLKYRVVYCQRIKADGTRVTVKNSHCKGKRPPFKMQCNRFSCPEWHSSGWSACSKPCGSAYQFRSVVCQSKREEEDNKLLPAGQCDAVKKPESQRDCNLGPCKGLKWITTDWKLCKKCNDTTETREVHCEDSSGRRFPEEKCTEEKPTESRDCLKPVPCLYQWHASQWGKCSTTCGHGHQRRAVVCAIEENGSKLKKVDEFHCDPKLKPENEQNCTNDEECTGTYFTGPWTQCSASCNGGTRSRSVVCFDYEFRLDMTQCDESKKPNTVEDCNKDPCLACNQTEFGCCPDEITPATGLYFDGCSNCSLSEFGCCPDNVTNAAGADFKGCFPLMDDSIDDSGSGEDLIKVMVNCSDDGCNVTEPELCDYTDSLNITVKLACSELCNFTDATNATLMIPCLNVTMHEMNMTGGNITDDDFLEDNSTKEIDCKDTEFGCCPDWYTPANGTNNEDCPIYELGKCHETKFGCCPDNVTLARGLQTAGCGDSSCAASLFGCCQDRTTIAFGPHYKGCEGRSASCENSDFGCCDDGKTAAQGPAGEGCADTCLMSKYGCCPNGKVAATGPAYEGCGCTYAQYGCCPDGKNAATGPSYMGCPETCATSRYGCCPDGKTIAQGANREGCPCQFSRYGCCPDSETPAEGPNEAGCDDCRRSRFGCCPDQVTKATGADYIGCPRRDENGLTSPAPIAEPPTPASEEAPAGDSSSCSLPNERGSCGNYVLRWFYDIDSGSCTQFWYGGCEGNGNRFSTEEQCQQTCISPPGDGLCYLPKMSGPSSCETVVVRWYYDMRESVCRPFHFRCNGNKNNFVSYDDCSAACDHLKNAGSILPETPRNGPHAYDTTTLVITTVAPTVVHTRVSLCEQMPDPGSCTSYYEQWYFDKNTGTCQTFVYGGCNGNGNRFISKEKCEERCRPKESVCDLPADRGKCKGKFEKWYFEKATGTCVTFIYGGCQGNRNRFNNQHDCEAKCVRHKTSPLLLPPTHRPLEPSDQPETSLPYLCTLNKDSGPCVDWSPKWFYDFATGSCDRFHYGGCNGNENKFETQASCEETCASKAEVCSLPPVTGPCRGSYNLFYYDRATAMCKQFIYGGCLGNKNRFDTVDACQQRCGSTLVVAVPGAAQNGAGGVTAKQPQVEGFVGVSLEPQLPPSTAVEIDNKIVIEEDRNDEICRLPKEKGKCRNNIPNFYYDPGMAQCLPFIYGGCGGNANRFKTVEDCEAACVRRTLENIRQIDNGNGNRESNDRELVNDEISNNIQSSNQPEKLERQENGAICQMPKDSGPCDQWEFRFFFDTVEGKCRKFHYGGCDGNDNNFDTEEECQSTCVQQSKKLGGPRGKETSSAERPPQAESRTYPLPTSEIPALCEQPKDIGTCFGEELMWHYSREGGNCVSFMYTGCGGNTNRFASEEACERACGIYRDQNVCSMDNDPGPCLSSVPKWYFDSSKAQCETFIFGGCNGNGNRFASREECENLCKAESRPSEDTCKLPKVVGICKAMMPRWYFDSASQMCLEFIYGGCGGNSNNFATKELCEQQCGSRDVQVEEDACNADRDPGPCVEAVSMWYHDKNTQECKLFTYGGCRGNQNRFDTKEQCERRCKVKPTSADLIDNREEICRLEFQKGPCRAAFPRWYYDSKQQTCREFTFGGCYGNENNFETRELCQKTCAGVFTVSDDSTTESKAHVTAEAARTHYRPGSVIHIHCRTPRLSVKHLKHHKSDVVWFKEGKRIDETVSTRYHISKNGTLKIMDAGGFDEGNYSCAARNGKGHISSPVQIIVAADGQRSAVVAEGSGCRDNPTFANCRLVVAAKLCDHKYYGQYCCHSCKGAGVAGVRRRFKV